MSKDVTEYDQMIIIAINTAFFNMYQMGIGPSEKSFSIKGKDETWDKFMVVPYIDSVKTYVSTITRIHFDPPQSSLLLETLKELAKEQEFRLMIESQNEEGGNRS